MTDTRFVKPKPGLTVNRPDGTPLPVEGETVTWSSWWRRRLNDGDIDVAEHGAPAATKSTSKQDAAKQGGGKGDDK